MDLIFVLWPSFFRSVMSMAVHQATQMEERVRLPPIWDLAWSAQWCAFPKLRKNSWHFFWTVRLLASLSSSLAFKLRTFTWCCDLCLHFWWTDCAYGWRCVWSFVCVRFVLCVCARRIHRSSCLARQTRVRASCDLFLHFGELARVCVWSGVLLVTCLLFGGWFSPPIECCQFVCTPEYVILASNKWKKKKVWKPVARNTGAWRPVTRNWNTRAIVENYISVEFRKTKSLAQRQRHTRGLKTSSPWRRVWRPVARGKNDEIKWDLQNLYTRN